MRGSVLLTALIGMFCTLACSGANSTAGTSTTAVTAPPAQTAVIGRSTPSSQAAITTPQPAPADVMAIVDQVRLRLTELPQEYSYGPFAAFQSNQAAVTGYDQPDAVLKRMNDTGRLGGFVQSLTTSQGPGGALTIEVWRDAAGATAYFDQYPRPDASLKYQQVKLPQPLGQQSFAYQYQSNGQTGYSVTWRQGRLLLGVGLQFFPGKESLDKVLALATLLDQKAQQASP